MIEFTAPQTSPPASPSFAIGLQREDREALAQAYAGEILRSLQARRVGSSASKGLEQDLQEWWDRYEAVPPNRELPFEGAANLRIPLTRWVVDAIHGRIFAGLAGVRPYFQVSPTEPQEAERAARAEEFLDYVAEHELRYAEWLDDALRNALVEGTAIGYLTWDRRVEHRLAEQAEPVAEPVIDPETGIPVTDGLGLPVIRRSVRSSIVEREDVVFEGPRLDLVPLVDFLVADWRRKNLADQPWCGHRTRLYAPELEALKGQEGYFDEEIDELLRSGGNMPTESAVTTHQQGLEKRVGVSESSQTSALRMLRWYDIWTLLAWYDWDRDGKPERVLLEIAMPQQRLIRAIKYPYLHGRPNYIVLRILPRSDHFLGSSLVAALMHVQDELDAFYNSRTDATSVAIRSLFTFLIGDQANINLERGMLQLGRPIRVEGDINQIQSLARAFRGVTPPGVDIENQLLAYAERLSGISDPQIGRPVSGRRTAFEIGAVIQEGNVRFRRYIERCEASLVEIGYQVIGLYQQHSSRVLPKVYYVLNDRENPFRTVEPGEIAGRFNFRVRGAAIASMMDLDARKAMDLLMLAEQSSLFRSFVQQSPARAHKLLKIVLDKLGGGDLPVEAIIGTEQEAAQAQLMASPQPGPAARGGQGEVAGQGQQGAGLRWPPSPAEVAPEAGVEGAS